MYQDVALQAVCPQVLAIRIFGYICCQQALGLPASTPPLLANWLKSDDCSLQQARLKQMSTSILDKLDTFSATVLESERQLTELICTASYELSC